MKKYVLGVDGGGTKTHYAVYNIEERTLKIIEGGAANHEVMDGGFVQLKDTFRCKINEICRDLNIELNDIGMSVWGLAGVDTKEQHNIISDVLVSIGVENFVLCNDSYLGIKAGCPKGYGLCANNGTGFTVSAIDEHDGMVQIGGLGVYTGDNGGGSVMVAEAISRVYENLYKMGNDTLMKDMIFDEFNINDKADFTQIIAKELDEDYSRILLKISKFLYQAADESDEVALDILKSVGTEYGKSICGALNELNFESDYELDIILTGSQFVKGSNQTAIETLKKYVSECDTKHKFNYKVLEQSCSMGAVLWALEKLNIKDEHYNDVLECFKQ